MLLAQNRVAEAKAEIDRALALDPTRSTARAALSQYLIETGQTLAARDEAQAAVADNPGYGRALVQLAEIDYRLGDAGLAQQQLDAADRLDPESPMTPVARAAIALQSYDIDAAIRGSREALRRFQARGGVYSSLSENRITGSYAAQSFRFAGLDEWARYYGDRVFDTVTPSSYFDQALNRPVDPFFTAPIEPIGFDPTLGKSQIRLASFLQGLAFDPLAVTYPKARLQFFKEEFSETSLNAVAGRTRAATTPSAFVTQDGLTHSPFPIAYSVSAGHREANRRQATAPEDNAEFFRGWLGGEPGPNDNLVALADLERLASQGFEPTTGLAQSSHGHDANLYGIWNHEFADRNSLTLGVGHRDRESETRVGAATAQIDRHVRFTTATASWNRNLDRLDLEAGAEHTTYRNHILTDATPGAPITDDLTTSRFRQTRAYVDARWAPYGPISLQGQVAWTDSRLRAAGRNVFPVGLIAPTDKQSVDFHVAATWEPRARHWLRAAFLRETSTEVPFTFAPTYAAGLRADVLPAGYGGQFDTAVVRWEGEWSPRVFSNFEVQRQTFDALLVARPDEQPPLGFADARLERARAAVNVWPGGGVGVQASYAWADTKGTQVVGGRPFPGRRLPFVPRHFAQAQFTWTNPARVRVELRQTYASSVVNFAQARRGASHVTDASLLWEPLDKRAEVKLVIENLFHARKTVRPTPGRLVAASLAYRF